MKKNIQGYIKYLLVIVGLLSLVIIFFTFIRFVSTQSFFTHSTDEIIGFVKEDPSSNHVWYVNPQTRERYFARNNEQVRELIMDNLLGIAEADFHLINVSPALTKRLLGTLILRVQHFGEAYYVDPASGALMYLGRINDIQPLLTSAKIVPAEVLRPILVSSQSASFIIPPQGYTAKLLATGFTKPRVLALDDAKQLYVTDFKEEGEVIALLDENDDGFLETKKTIIPNLFNPHGITFANGKLFVATEHALYSWHYDEQTVSVISPPTKEMTFPPGAGGFAGQGHKTRTVIDGGDGNLYISVGSNCDHCVGADQEYGLVYQRGIETGTTNIFARGLRNTVFLAKDPVSGLLWGNDMGQDNLGPDLPPDELNRLVEGGHYGWPYCYGLQVPTPENEFPDRCAQTIPNAFSYPAHSAPLGLRFIPNQFSEEFESDVLVSLHGSSVIDKRVGYKIIRVQMDQGLPTRMEDYVLGFLEGEVILGRPVDLLFDQKGNLYITDDYAHVVHVIRPAHAS